MFRPCQARDELLPTESDPPKIYRYLDRDLGGRVTMSMMEIISHTGTHIDGPLHFIPGGATISDMPLDAAIGPCRVIEIKDPEKITVGNWKDMISRRANGFSSRLATRRGSTRARNSSKTMSTWMLTARVASYPRE